MDKRNKADDIAIDIEEWLDRKLLKETNETIVGIRQLYKSSSQLEKTIIGNAIDRCITIKHHQILVGLLQ